MLKGRRRELIAAALLYLFGGLVTGYAPGLNVLLLGRLLYGLGIGLVRFSDNLVVEDLTDNAMSLSIKSLYFIVCRPCMVLLSILQKLAHHRFVELSYL
jgi:MFS family permease